MFINLIETRHLRDDILALGMIVFVDPPEGSRLLRVIRAKLVNTKVSLVGYTDIFYVRPFGSIMVVIHLDDTTLLLGHIVKG